MSDAQVQRRTFDILKYGLVADKFISTGLIRCHVHHRDRNTSAVKSLRAVFSFDGTGHPASDSRYSPIFHSADPWAAPVDILPIPDALGGALVAGTPRNFFAGGGRREHFFAPKHPNWRDPSYVTSVVAPRQNGRLHRRSSARQRKSSDRPPSSCNEPQTAIQLRRRQEHGTGRRLRPAC
jgi:hypothetical protein